MTDEDWREREAVSRSTCKVLHAQLDKRCDERHETLEARLTDLTDAIKGLGSDLRAMVLERATDQAWALIGKYGITLVAFSATAFGIVQALK